MREAKITCIVCPMGCGITVFGEEDRIESVEGYACRRGEAYARNEFLAPARILTTTVKLSGAKGLVPVRSDKPLPKGLLLKCMDEINRVTVRAPVHMYDVVLADILGTGIDIVATCNAE